MTRITNEQREAIVRRAIAERDALLASHAETVPHVPAPMVDRQGNVLAVGDTIRHPESGETATVQLDPKREGLGQWRAVYATGESLWLGNQIERGDAVKVSHAETVPHVPAAFNPAKGSSETAAQMAAVMLMHGTPDQQRQALETVPHVPAGQINFAHDTDWAQQLEEVRRRASMQAEAPQATKDAEDDPRPHFQRWFNSPYWDGSQQSAFIAGWHKALAARKSQGEAP